MILTTIMCVLHSFRKYVCMKQEVAIFWTEQLKGSWDLISQSRAPVDFGCSSSANEASEGAILSCCSSIKSFKHLAWHHRRILWQKQGWSPALQDSFHHLNPQKIILSLQQLLYLHYFSAWELTGSQPCEGHLVSSKKVGAFSRDFHQKLLQRVKQDSHHPDLSGQQMLPHAPERAGSPSPLSM